MKVAYFINQYPKVSHTFIRREILALERQGINVERYALRGWLETPPDSIDLQEQGRTRYILRAGLAGLIVPSLKAAIGSPRRFLRALRLAIRVWRGANRSLPLHLVCVAEACQLVTWLRASRVDHLHAHFGTNSAEVAMYAHCLGGPSFSFTVHGPEEFEAPMALAEKVRESTFAVAISSYGRSQLYLRCPAAQWPKIKVVHCGIEPAFYGANAPRVPQSDRLICVGRLCEQKGQLMLIEAIACLRAKGIDLHVVLAGDGPLRAEVERAVEHHGLKEVVRITGWISSERVRDELLASRALVLPSFAEGLPIVLMEAMALRRPVLTTFIAGIPELVHAGENGWLFPAGSLEDLTSAMEDCLSRSNEEIERMGDAARSRVLERHSIDVEAAKLADLFKSATASRRPERTRSAVPMIIESRDR